MTYKKISLFLCQKITKPASMKSLVYITMLVCLAGFFRAQETRAQENNWRDYLQQLAEEDDANDAQIENMYDELSSLENNPYNLNTVTREQLERFSLLSLEQATSLADFLEKNRPVYTVYELRNVPLLDYNTVELILPFFYVGEQAPPPPKTLGEMVKNGRNEVQLRFDKTLEKRAGYGEFSDSILTRYPNRKYLGEDVYTALKYSFAYRDKIQFGLVGEKDAGEPFLKSNYRKGFDYYGIHLLLRDVGALKTIAVGDYRLSFGQGLVLNNNFMTPKAWASSNLIRHTMEPKRHFSTAESGFFRGAATVVQFKNVALTAFYSNKRIDANLSKEDEITSLKTDGYHRVPLDTAKRNNVREQVMGANVNYRRNAFQIGFSGVYYTFSKPFNPTPQDYNRYFFRGSENANFSVDYSYRFARFSFGGETAVSENGAVATLNAIEYRPQTPYVGSVSLSYRNYAKAYQALYAQAFGESGTQNETGLYIGSTLYPIPKLTLTTYIDFIRYPYLRYNVDEPSNAVDFYANAAYSFTRNSVFEIRYKLKQKEKNTKYPDEKTTWVLPYVTHKLRLRYSRALESGWDFRSTADMAMYQVQYFPREYGWMLSQNIGYRGEGKWRGDFFAAYFNADSYYARLYSYERNILNTFYMPSFYGKGIRLALSARYELLSDLSFSVKIGHTRYFDRDVISSGTEQINGNHRTDIFTYVRWRF